MKTYYAIVDVEATRWGTYVQAENTEEAFELARLKCKRYSPRLHVETLAVQEMAEDPDYSVSH